MLLKIPDSANDITFDYVVPEHNANTVTCCKMLYQGKSGGDAALAFLICVIDMLQAKCLTVPEQFQEIARGVSSSDDHNIGDARINQRLNRIIDHRLVVYG